MYLLDTNVVSETRRLGDGKADQNVTRWLSKQNPETLFVSVITVMELEIGVQRMERRDASQGGLLRRWFSDRVLPAFWGRILPIDLETSLACARLHVPDPRSERDALIAATALVRSFSVVTRNIADFRETKVRVIDPWMPQPSD